MFSLDKTCLKLALQPLISRKGFNHLRSKTTDTKDAHAVKSSKILCDMLGGGERENMSIKGIKPGQVIPFPNNPVEKKANKSVENSKFDKTLDKASLAEQKSVEQTDKTTNTQNVIPIQPNYHVLNLSLKALHE